MLVAPSLENLLVAGRQRLENTLSRGGVGASSERFHCAGPKDILFISQLGRQHVTSHGAWHRSSRSPCPPSRRRRLWRMLNSILQRAGPLDPGAVTLRRKGWGKKDGGGWYFQLWWKIRTGFAGSGEVIQDQPANFLFRFRLGGENPPTPALFPHPAPRHSPSGFSIHGKICRVSHHSPSLSFCWFFCLFVCLSFVRLFGWLVFVCFLFFLRQEGKLKKKKKIIFPSSPPTWNYSDEITKSCSVSPQPWKPAFSWYQSSKNIALQNETFSPAQKTMGHCNRAPKI